LFALTKNRDDAEEVAQDFFLWVTQHGFPRVRRERGRFRDYVKIAVRNAALNFLQRKRPRELTDFDLSQVPSPPEHQPIPDQEWIVAWRKCLLKRAWQELENQEKPDKSPYYVVLRLTATNPQEDSNALAARAAEMLGRPIRPD